MARTQPFLVALVAMLLVVVGVLSGSLLYMVWRESVPAPPGGWQIVNTLPIQQSPHAVQPASAAGSPSIAEVSPEEPTPKPSSDGASQRH